MVQRGVTGLGGAISPTVAFIFLAAAMTASVPLIMTTRQSDQRYRSLILLLSHIAHSCPPW